MNFFKLYIGDYQRDTAHLSVTEHGAFLLMLQHYYATEKPLPTGKALHRMLRAQDKAERDAIDVVVSQFWTETEAGLINGRADKEIARASDQAEVNRQTAMLREARRKAAREAHEQSTNRATNDQPNQTPDTRLNTNPPTPRKRGKPAEPAGFDEFWSAYPRKVAKGAALKAWAKAKPDEPLQQQILAAIGRARDGPDWRKDGGAFIPHPATWLNAQRWLDEPVTVVAVAPAVDVWKPPPAMTAEERAASDEARKRVMSALKVVA